MGNRSLRVLANDTDDSVTTVQQKLSAKYKIPDEVKVAHFTPSIFPLVPLIHRTNTQLCKDSWKIITDNREKTESGLELNGITLFYNDFYEHLKILDENGKIEAVLSAHSTGKMKSCTVPPWVLRNKKKEVGEGCNEMRT